MSETFLRAVSLRALDVALASRRATSTAMPQAAAASGLSASARAGKRAPIGNRAAAPPPVSAAVAAPMHSPKIKAGLIPRSTWRPKQAEPEEDLPELESAMKIRTPRRPELHDAAKDGNVAAVQAALQARGGDGVGSSADVNGKYLGQAPIHLAAKAGHVAVASLLLDRGADLHARATNTGNKNSTLVWDFGGATPLHCAAEMNQTEVVTLLLARGAELDARANCDDTPLHFAAREGWLAATRLLVARGADPFARNTSGQTAHDDAMECGGGKCPCEDVSGREWPAVSAFLAHVMRMGDGDDARVARMALAQKAWQRPVAAELHDAAEKGDVSELKRLLAAGCDVAAPDYDGSCALHAAAYAGHEASLAVLLGHGASVNAVTNYRDTALHVAAREGRLEAAKLLVARGADVRAINRFGLTPREAGLREPRPDGWEGVAAMLEEETKDVDELPPGARALRKIRAAMLRTQSQPQQQPPQPPRPQPPKPPPQPQQQQQPPPPQQPQQQQMEGPAAVRAELERVRAERERVRAKVEKERERRRVAEPHLEELKQQEQPGQQKEQQEQVASPVRTLSRPKATPPPPPAATAAVAAFASIGSSPPDDVLLTPCSRAANEWYAKVQRIMAEHADDAVAGCKAVISAALDGQRQRHLAFTDGQHKTLTALQLAVAKSSCSDEEVTRLMLAFQISFVTDLEAGPGSRQNEVTLGID